MRVTDEEIRAIVKEEILNNPMIIGSSKHGAYISAMNSINRIKALAKERKRINKSRIGLHSFINESEDDGYCVKEPKVIHCGEDEDHCTGPCRTAHHCATEEEDVCTGRSSRRTSRC